MSIVYEENYKEFKIYFPDLSGESKTLLEKIMNDDFIKESTLQEKEDRKVDLISINGKKYILKSEKTRGVLSRFFKSKARITLENVLELKAKGFNNLYNIRMAIEKISKGRIIETFLLIEYIEGRAPKTILEYKEVMETLKKLHSFGHYHGDSKPKNFIYTSKGVILIDSKLKKNRFFILHKCKDVLRFQRRTKEVLPIKNYFKKYKLSPAYYVAILLIYKKEILSRTTFLQEVF